jgi:hypothetical protein
MGRCAAPGAVCGESEGAIPSIRVDMIHRRLVALNPGVGQCGENGKTAMLAATHKVSLAQVIQVGHLDH